MSRQFLKPTIRVSAFSITSIALVFILNNFLVFWGNWPGLELFFGHMGFLWQENTTVTLNDKNLLLAWLQILLYVLPILIISGIVIKTPERNLLSDSELFTSLAAYLIRSAFWAVFLIGFVDLVISFLRVEGFLPIILGEGLAKDLARPSYRGTNIHYPIILLSFIIGCFVKGLGFIWLTLLIVAAELLIVISRFVFSYEQAFMGDLVRFWYAALFLFASAYTLIVEGHVRVDILYTNFTERGKAWSNVFGTLILGIPVCWIILTSGLGGKSNVINAPLLVFEVSQSGVGLYVKYLMVGFLLIYALSMMIQFVGYFLSNTAVLMHEPGAKVTQAEDFTS